jgi:hypothetical protein
VSSSEFMVSVGASVGFLLALPWHEIDPVLVGALLVGGATAAPFAAWLTQHLDQRTLGSAIGAFIVATNARTLAGVIGMQPTVLSVASVVLAAAWVLAALRLAVTVRRTLALRTPGP